MGKNCSICNKKFSLMDNKYPLAYGMGNYEICEECSEYKRNLKQDNDLRQNAIIYFNKHMERSDVESEVKRVIEDTIKKDEEKSKALEDAKQREKELLEECLMTSGFNFEGYNILEYKGLVSGEVALGTGLFKEVFASLADTFGLESDDFEEKMIEAKKIAQIRLVKQAIKAGGNAVICVDYDYITFGNNMIGVSANGTAVIVKKTDSING